MSGNREHQSPLGRVKGLGSAKSGSRSWLNQKISAVILAVLFIWFSFSFAYYINQGFGEVTTWIGSPINAALLIALIVVGTYHGIVGIQAVADDYVSRVGRRLALMTVFKSLLVLFALVAVIAILKIAIRL